MKSFHQTLRPKEIISYSNDLAAIGHRGESISISPLRSFRAHPGENSPKSREASRDIHRPAWFFHLGERWPIVLSRIILLTSYCYRGFCMLSRRFSTVLFSSLLLVAVILGLPNLFSFPRVEAVNSSISLVGFVNAWNFTSTQPNPTITVTQGDSVTLQLSSGDAVLHRWFVDVDKNGPSPDCPGADICSNAFSTSTVLTFTVNFSPGTYTYYCSVHPTTMLGQFIVNPSSVGGTTLPTNGPELVAPYLALASALAILVAVVAYITHARRKDRKN